MDTFELDDFGESKASKASDWLDCLNCLDHIDPSASIVVCLPIFIADFNLSVSLRVVAHSKLRRDNQSN